MAETKKFYLDLAGLTHYDSKIKAYIASEIKNVNDNIADFTDVKDKATKSYNAWQSFLADWPTITVAPTLNALAATKATVDELVNTHYTKTQVDAIVGTPTEGKTVVGMISDLSTTVSDIDTAYKEADGALGERIKAIEDLDITGTYATKQSVADLTTTVNGKADKATTLAGYGITDAYTKDDVNGIKTELEEYADQAESDAIDAAKAYVDGLKIADTYATKQSVADLTITVNDKADKATTLAGYGITDAYTTTEVDTAIETAKKEILGITGDETINQAYDTLKEVAEWIESDTSGAAAMQQDIADLKSGKADKATTLAGYGITDAYTKDDVNGIKTELEEYADQAESDAIDASKAYVDGLKIADTYATKQSVADLTTTVNGKADKATTLAGYGITDAYTKDDVNGIKTELEEYADQAESDAIDASKAYVDGLKIADTYATKDELTDGLANKTSMSVGTDGVVFTQGEITVSPIANSEIDKLFATA